MILAVPSLEVKSKILSRTITRAVESLSQVVSSVNELGVAAFAFPPPVVPAACPNGVPTARAEDAKHKATSGPNILEEAKGKLEEGIGVPPHAIGPLNILVKAPSERGSYCVPSQPPSGPVDLLTYPHGMPYMASVAQSWPIGGRALNQSTRRWRDSLAGAEGGELLTGP